MKMIILLLIFSCFATSSFCQQIVSDRYHMHDYRVIETETIDISVSGDVKVRLSIFYGMTKNVNVCVANFIISYIKADTDYFGPSAVLKTSSGKIYESSDGKISDYSYINVFNLPSPWKTISWQFSLDKKNIKYFSNENIEKIRIKMGRNSLDLVFIDETFTNFIREGYKALIERSKTKLPESENPPLYKNF